jgi:RNA polymerase sigma factor (sigma-70 family)
LYRTAFRLLGNAADAEDAVQDALVSAYTHLDQFRGQSRMSTWLTSIVLNSARMQLRRRLRHVHLAFDEHSGENQTSALERLVDRPCEIARKISPLLVRHFVAKYAARMQKHIDRISKAVMDSLVSHSWPGNIRELQNFIERSVILTRGNTLCPPLAKLCTAGQFELSGPPTNFARH